VAREAEAPHQSRLPPPPYPDGNVSLSTPAETCDQVCEPVTALSGGTVHWTIFPDAVQTVGPLTVVVTVPSACRAESACQPKLRGTQANSQPPAA
jgi:hypothetical protein